MSPTASAYAPTVTTDPRSRAWDAIHDALPDGWAVGPAAYDPGRRAWTVVAHSAPPAGRYRPPEYMEAQGEDQVAALTYLALALDERRGEERRVEIGMRARLAYVQGAEGEALRSRGRGLTGEELERFAERYPVARKRTPTRMRLTT